MKINYLSIKNFKSIKELEIKDIDNALILVGRNSSGKTVILDAIMAAIGRHRVNLDEFNENGSNIEIGIKLSITSNDLELLHKNGMISKYKKYELWIDEFKKRLPSYHDEILEFTAIIHEKDGLRYEDGFSKNNPYIQTILPKVYSLDYQRRLEELHEDMFFNQKDAQLGEIRENKCIFDGTKICTGCFQCIGKIKEIPAGNLTIAESVRLLEYKLFQVRLDSFGEKVNEYFHKNGNPMLDAHYMMHLDIDKVFHIDTRLVNRESGKVSSLKKLSAGARSIYMLSMLEAYVEEEYSLPCIILIEDPELFLHPQLQKIASEILYRLSTKNQIIFSTHSPNMIFNFTSKQIRQVVLDKNYCTTVQASTNLSVILNDLGYTASDLMDVSFVFFVEGRQDKSRLPLLLRKYYSEIVGENGQILRTAIISTNSCTNIKTYANLKYMNQLYIKDQFLMIRDGDGKDREKLAKDLCGYYYRRNKEDEYTLPRVTRRNVLILKYYSFENYFLDPNVMTEIGVVKSVDQFFNILWKKYKQYLYRLSSFINLKNKTGIEIKSRQDLIDNYEAVKIYGRGHNLYDIYYGRYRGEKEQEILTRYIDVAPRETFDDILEAIDSFVYFHNRRK